MRVRVLLLPGARLASPAVAGDAPQQRQCARAVVGQAQRYAGPCDAGAALGVGRPFVRISDSPWSRASPSNSAGSPDACPAPARPGRVATL